MEQVENLIIGAGPAGLAIAGRLAHRKIPYLLIEREQTIAHSWRNHYTRLHLHTVKKYSHLPHQPFPKAYPQYIPRQQLVDYYDNYVQQYNIQPAFGEAIESIVRQAGSWQVQTSQRQLLAKHVVIATGFNRVPYAPTWEGTDTFNGTITHSRTYKDGAAYKGQRVLVVGLGNTGAEVALDLSEHGADASVSIRGPVNFIPRDLFGRPTQLTAMLLAKFPNSVADRIAVISRSLSIGDLSRYGIETPTIPPSAQLRELGKTPVIDVGTLAKIKSGAIKILPDIKQFTQNGVVMSDGKLHPFDHVIMATGYRPQVEAFLQTTTPFLNHLGVPKDVVGSDGNEGLFFLGYDAYEAGGLLFTILRDSELVAERIAG